MTAAVETMAYVGQVPWHGLGNKTTAKTPQQMLKDGEIDWTVSKRKMFLEGSKSAIPGAFALCRDSDNKVLSVVGAKYKPVQNADAMDFFKKFVDAGHMTMETVGSLHGGRFIWGLAKIGANFSIGKDTVKGYLLLSSPHVRGKALVIKFTPIRVVCWNTLTFALGNNLKGGAGDFRMPHLVEFDGNMRQSAEIALGLATDQMASFHEAATLLSKKKVDVKQVEEYFCQVLHFDPKKAEKEGERVPRNLKKFREALTYAPGQQLPSAKGTLWGALNAVTYVADHQLGKNRETALRSAWLGQAANLKRRALNVALDAAA